MPFGFFSRDSACSSMDGLGAEQEIVKREDASRRRVENWETLYKLLHKELLHKEAEAADIIRKKDEEFAEQTRAMKELEAELRRAKTAAEVQRQFAESARRRHEDAVELLGRRTVELDVAQTFLPIVETVTDTHIVRLVKELNYEISQAATSLAESYEGIPPLHSTHFSPGLSQPTVHRTRIAEVADRLVYLYPNDAITLLQIVVQALMVDLARAHIHRWRFERSTGLSEIFAILRAEDRTDVEEWLASKFAGHIAMAVTSAGHNDGRDLEARGQMVLSQLKRQLGDIVRLILELNEVIGQKVHDGWMEMDCVGLGEIFDPDGMEAAYRSPEDTVVKGRREVLCTTALGLCRKSDTAHVRLLKAMVVLDGLHGG
ncbi:hypothetical protein K488DRAFT_71650 [Vararia minispora EC-137]|uniref:Uncharacterized protein n=1 Tax=Vararia minispora EC-137 TaxID=1314806 RepID=A0ACB8QHP6_9AGAM|nr:hypothetical protein K488DRAFT_71650 [Vararia minispora EC-137]